MARKTSSGVSNSTSKKMSVSDKMAKLELEADEKNRLLNYSKAEQMLLQLKDPNKGYSSSISSYDRKKIRDYLKAPSNNEVNLRNAARYLFFRSQIFFRIIVLYSSIWDLRCRKVIPNYDISKKPNISKTLKAYNSTLNKLDIYNIHGNIYNVLIHCYLEDICYSLFFRDDSGSMFYILDPDECKIIGRYHTGDLGFAIDMSKWKSDKKQKLIEWLGSPLKEMWEEYQKNPTAKWVKVPDEYAACFKFRIEDLNAIIPPFAPLLQRLAGLNDLEDIQAIADEQSIYKLLLVPMKVLSGAKRSDDFQVSPDLMIKYFDKMVENALPDYVAAAPIPGDGVDVIDFTKSSADKDVDRLEQSQSTLLATAGGGAVLNANNINNTAAFNAWLKAESEFAISSLMPQIEGFTNRMLSLDVPSPCKVEYFEITIFTKEELKKSLLESCQYSFSNRLAYNTLNGISEKDTLAMDFLETEVLKLPSKMINPLQSSYTTSNSQTSSEGGRPRSEDDQVSDGADRMRNLR